MKTALTLGAVPCASAVRTGSRRASRTKPPRTGIGPRWNPPKFRRAGLLGTLGSRVLPPPPRRFRSRNRPEPLPTGTKRSEQGRQAAQAGEEGAFAVIGRSVRLSGICTHRPNHVRKSECSPVWNPRLRSWPRIALQAPAGGSSLLHPERRPSLVRHVGILPTPVFASCARLEPAVRTGPLDPRSGLQEPAATASAGAVATNTEAVCPLGLPESSAAEAGRLPMARPPAQRPDRAASRCRSSRRNARTHACSSSRRPLPRRLSWPARQTTGWGSRSRPRAGCR